ncbi:MAG: hypothetical protein AB7O62_12545 [Pirellulales bacterium]
MHVTHDQPIEPTIAVSSESRTGGSVMMQNLALMGVVVLVWRVSVWCYPPLAVLGFPLAVVIVWALVYACLPNAVKYATVLLGLAAMLLGLLLPGVLQLRDQARFNTSTDHLRSQWEAFRGVRMLHEGKRPSARIAVEPDTDEQSVESARP